MADSRGVKTLRSLNYNNIVPLGHATTGAVFSADDKDGRRVAVKLAFTAADRDLLRQEAEILQSLPPNEHILSVLSFSNSPFQSVLVTPLAAGGDSLQLMQENKNAPMPEDQARLLFLQLLDALSAIHKAGIVHRDIKCENILLDAAKENLKLGDFGFAARFEHGAKSLSEPWGSIHYSAPEIVAKVPYEGPEVDLWSAGVVLYAWVTGRLPFGGDMDKEVGLRVLQATYPEPKHVSAPLVDLFARIFTAQGNKRITMAQLFAHPWITTPIAPRPRSSLAAIFDRPRSASAANIVPMSPVPRKYSTQMNNDEFARMHGRDPTAAAAAADATTPASRRGSTAQLTTEKSGALSRVAKFFSSSSSKTPKAPSSPLRAESMAAAAEKEEPN